MDVANDFATHPPAPPTTKIALKLEMRELLLSIVAIPAMAHILIVTVTGLAIKPRRVRMKPIIRLAGRPKRLPARKRWQPRVAKSLSQGLPAQLPPDNLIENS